MTENYDTSWDLIESNKDNLPDDEDAYERKYQEWMERDWIPWLREHLSFPFQVKRMEDEDDAYFTDVAKRKPFRLDHIMEVIGIEEEDPVGPYGAKGIGEIGLVPTAAAVANALYTFDGIRRRSLPMKRVKNK